MKKEGGPTLLMLVTTQGSIWFLDLWFVVGVPWFGIVLLLSRRTLYHEVIAASLENDGSSVQL